MSAAGRSGGFEDLSWQTSRAGRVRSYRAADRLEDIRRTFDELLAGGGAATFRSSLSEVLEEVAARLDEDEFERLGLGSLDGGGLFDLDRRDRARFARGVQLGDQKLLALLLDGQGSGGADQVGLIEALREIVKEELTSRAGGRRIGTVIDTYA